MPATSTRLTRRGGCVSHIRAPGPRRYAFTTMPPTTCSACSPVNVKYSPRKLLAAGTRPWAYLSAYSSIFTARKIVPSATVSPMYRRYRERLPFLSAIHAIAIVTDDVSRITVFSAASGMLTTDDWSGQDGAPVRSSAYAEKNDPKSI